MPTRSRRRGRRLVGVGQQLLQPEPSGSGRGGCTSPCRDFGGAGANSSSSPRAARCDLAASACIGDGCGGATNSTSTLGQEQGAALLSLAVGAEFSQAQQPALPRDLELVWHLLREFGQLVSRIGSPLADFAELAEEGGAAHSKDRRWEGATGGCELSAPTSEGATGGCELSAPSAGESGQSRGGQGCSAPCGPHLGQASCQVSFWQGEPRQDCSGVLASGSGSLRDSNQALGSDTQHLCWADSLADDSNSSHCTERCGPCCGYLAKAGDRRSQHDFGKSGLQPEYFSLSDGSDCDGSSLLASPRGALLELVYAPHELELLVFLLDSSRARCDPILGKWMAVQLGLPYS